jgi:hypothetical protein
MKSLVIALGLVLTCLAQADAQRSYRHSTGGYQSSRTTVDVRLNSGQGSYSARSFSNTYGSPTQGVYQPRYVGPGYSGPVYYYPMWEGTYYSTGDSSIMMGNQYMVPARPYRHRYR